MTTGFNDWKHADNRIASHENSPRHRNAMIALCARKTATGRVDTELTHQFESERQYWRMLLHRVVSVVQFLCERGLAFRGRDEVVGSSGNGNYLGILELLSGYDTFLAEHIRKHGNKGRGHTSYLSSTICEEVITIMGGKVIEAIIKELKTAKDYSISVDSTPDITHIDQLTTILRYVLPTGPVERFLTYIPMFGHAGSDITDIFMSFLDENGINIRECRGQSYDNAANMSGKYI